MWKMEENELKQRGEGTLKLTAARSVFFKIWTGDCNEQEELKLKKQHLKQTCLS